MKIIKKHQHWLYIVTIFGGIAFHAPNLQAKVWANAYINFEIPDRWKCILEQTEWVCRSEDSAESKEAIIILTAKEIGPTDTFQLYEGHLSNPISVPLRNGGASTSKVYKKPEYNQIQSLKWIDGFHLSSEVPDYFTRYLATIKEKIAVLVTFSAHKNVYAKYSSDFMKAIQSLRVIASKSLTSGAGTGVRSTNEAFFGANGLMPSEPLPNELPTKKKDKTLFIALAAIIAALGIFIFLKARKR